MALPLRAPTTDELIEQLAKGDQEELVRLLVRLGSAQVGVAPRDRYYHWDRLRHLTPPAGFSSEEWWLGVKFARRSLLRELPLKDPEGKPFRFGIPDEAQELLHFVDQHASGEIRMPEVVTGSEAARKHYLVNSMIEEAIRSSQLEGAATTHAVAKEMIRTGRPPRDRSERMILNNFRAMEFMLEEVGRELTPELVIELQRILTEGTLDDPEASGRIQRPDEDRVVVGNIIDGSVLHIPPPAEQLKDRMELMCRFANGEKLYQGFMHPVVKAILLHFWLAYDHPFEDGNGRTARALFYWSMETQGYWLTEYLSISRILRQGPSKYLQSFLHTETDERDTTYFILFQLGVIRRAIEELHTYLQRKMQEVREVETVLRGSDDFNYRQLALLSNALRQPSHSYTFRSHSISHKVTHQTARTDLLDLRKKGLLEMRKVGRQYVFRPALDLGKRLARIGSANGSRNQRRSRLASR